MIRFFIKILIIIAVIYAGVITAIPWVKYYVFRVSFNGSVENVKKYKDFDFVKNILERAEELHIKIDRKNIKIEDIGDKRKYSIEYSETVFYPIVNKEITFDFKLERYIKIGEGYGA